jgi:hypothetical protein
MDKKPHRITLGVLFLALTLSCVIAGLCVASPRQFLTFAVNGAAFVGGMLLAERGGYFAAITVIVAAVATNPPSHLIAPAMAAIWLCIIYCAPVTMLAFLGASIARRLARR